jgi:hypothetical protein
MTAKKASVTVASLLFAGLAFGASTETAKAGHHGCYSYGYSYAPPVYVAPPPVYYAPPPVYYYPGPAYYAPRYSYRSYGYYPRHHHHRSFGFGFSY